MLLEHGLRFKQRLHTRNSVKERDPICVWTNGIAQPKLFGVSPSQQAWHRFRGTKTRSLEAFSQYSVFHLWFVHSEARKPSLARLSKRFRTAGTNGCLNLTLTWRVSENPQTIQNMIGVQRSTLSQGECCSHSAKLSCLDA